MKDFNNYLTCRTDGVLLKQGPWRYVTLLLAFSLLFEINAYGQAVAPGTASVSPPAGGFGIDGDLRANTPTSGIGDWLPGTGAGGAVLNSFGVPIVSSTTFHSMDLYTSGDNVFAGGQKKNDNPNFMTWINGNPSPAKNDINNLLMHISRDANQDIWITVAGDRESVNGNSFISIALHQAMLTMETGGTFKSDASNSTGGRTPGDLQVSAEFTGGGTSPNLYLEEWKSVDGVYQWAATPVPANSAYGKTNATILSGIPYDAFGSTSYPINAFIEVSFNISEFYRNTATPCVGSISSAFVMTKSSQSVTANLTDFVEPIQINLDINVGKPVATGDDYCVGETINSITATGETGAVFKWYTSLTDGKPSGTPTTGATFTPTISNAVAGTANYYVTQTIRGCESAHTVVTVTVNALPTIATPAIGDICFGATSASLTHGGITANGNQYRIDWNAAANTAGLADVSLTNVPTPSSPISISVPGTLAVATYSGTIYVKNTTTGCESTGDAITLKVNPNPVADAGSSPAAQCYIAAGNNFELDGDGANGTALWAIAPNGNPNNLTVDITNGTTFDPTVKVTGVGTVTLRLTVTSGFTPSCGSRFDDVSVTVNAKPGAPAVEYIAPKCNETTFSVKVLSPVVGVDYSITESDGSSNLESIKAEEGKDVIFEGRAAGSGYIVIATIGECVSEANECGVVASNSIGNQETSSSLLDEKGVINDTPLAYPIPFYDKTTIEFRAAKDGNYVINLYDLKGSLIRQLKSGTAKAGELNKVEIDGIDLPEGMYLARIVSGSGAKTVKLLKRR